MEMGKPGRICCCIKRNTSLGKRKIIPLWKPGNAGGVENNREYLWVNLCEYWLDETIIISYGAQMAPFTRIADVFVLIIYDSPSQGPTITITDPWEPEVRQKCAFDSSALRRRLDSSAKLN